MGLVRNEGRVGKNKPNHRAATRDPVKKDLIHIRNIENGKVYKFACSTCINGHRAPQCDPAKHRDKVLFRRPEPGRPAKNCGHPVSQKCDCSAQRNLCCNLDSTQWAQLIAGEIPTVTMYENEQKLNEVENEARFAQQIQQQAQQQAQAYEQAVQAANQWTYQAMPYRPAPHEMQYVQDPGQMILPYLYNQAMPGSFDFLDNQQDPMAFDPAAYQAPYVAPFEPGFEQAAYQAPFEAPYQPMFEPAAFEPASYQAPFVPGFHQPQAFNLPDSAPRSQFPCQSCASFSCTCLRCPPVRQGSNGAWSVACGRSGHIDNNPAPLKQEFSFAEDFSQQPPLDPSQVVEFTSSCETPLTFNQLQEELAGFSETSGL